MPGGTHHNLIFIYFIVNVYTTYVNIYLIHVSEMVRPMLQELTVSIQVLVCLALFGSFVQFDVS